MKRQLSLNDYLTLMELLRREIRASMAGIGRYDEIILTRIACAVAQTWGGVESPEEILARDVKQEED